MKKKIRTAIKYCILSFLLFQGLASANEAIEQIICVGLGKEECEKAKQKYWWGDKFEEVNAQITKIAIAMRNAVLSDNYDGLSQYMDFPVRFYIIEYKPDTDYDRISHWTNHFIEGIAYDLRNTFIKSGYLSKNRHNLEDSKKDYFRILSGSRHHNFDKGAGTIFSDLTLIDGYNDYSIWLYELHTIIGLKVICGGFHTMPEEDPLRLPEELHLCKNPKIRIRDMLVEFFI